MGVNFGQPIKTENLMKKTMWFQNYRHKVIQDLLYVLKYNTIYIFKKGKN